MEIFRIIRDADVGSVEAVPESFRERRAARAVVFDVERKIALFHSTKKHYHKLPGGGVEEGEDLEDALRARPKITVSDCAQCAPNGAAATEPNSESYCKYGEEFGDRTAAAVGDAVCAR